MKKVLAALLAAVLITVIFAGNVMAKLWAEGDLIRVVYDNKGSNEVATDLGSLYTISAGGTYGGGANAVSLSQFPNSKWSDLRVGYFMVSQTPIQTVAVSGALNGSVTSESGGYTSFQPAAGNLFGLYSITPLVSGATTTVSIPKAHVNSFYNQLDVGGGQLSQGDFGGFIVSNTNAAGVLSLADLATTGYVDQTLFTWSNTALDGAGSLAGTRGITLRTMADGSTIINPSSVPVDNNPPVLTVTAPVNGLVTNIAILSITGTAMDAGSGIKSVTVNGSSVTVGPGGDFSTIVNLVAGTKTIAVVATDNAGNITTVNRTVTMDQVPPVLTVTEPVNGLVTNNATLSVTGTATDPGSGIKLVTINGASVTVGVGGAFSSTITLVAGATTITVVASDNANNSSTVIRAVTLDLTQLDTTITVKPADPSNNAAPSFSFTATKTGSTFECKLDAGAFAACTSPKAFAGLTAGSHTFSVQAKDPAGNVDPTPASYTWTIDLTPPLLAVSALLDGSFTNNSTPNVSGTATDALSGIKSVTVNGLAVNFNADGVFSAAVPLIAGANTITVVATDKAGNSTTEGPRTITYDPIAPVVTITAPVDNSYSNVSPIVVSGAISETATVTVSVNGAPSTATVDGASFTASANLTTGLNHIEVVVTDPAKNTGSAKRTITYDPDKPNLAITDPAQDITTPQSSYTIKGTVSDSLTAVSKLVLTMDGQTYEPTITEGNFQQQLNFTTAKQYPILITATDQAGNSATAPRNIIYAPLIASGDVNSDGKVDVFDALLTLQYAVGLIEHTPESNTKYLAAADVSPLDAITGKPKGDGVVNVFDALAILRKAVNLDRW